MTTARPGRARSESSRQAILEATRDELTQRGYDKLSIDRIAAAAGVGKQTIYRWYPSKSALVAEGVLHGHLSPTIEVDRTGDVRADISAWMQAFAAASSDPEGAALLRATTSAAAENADVAARYEEQVTTLTREALTARVLEGVEDGQVRADAPVGVLVDSLLGAVLVRVLMRREPTAAVVDDLVDLVFDGLTVRAEDAG